MKMITGVWRLHRGGWGLGRQRPVNCTLHCLWWFIGTIHAYATSHGSGLRRCKASLAPACGCVCGRCGVCVCGVRRLGVAVAWVSHSCV